MGHDHRRSSAIFRKANLSRTFSCRGSKEVDRAVPCSMLMMAAEPQTCSIADPPFSNLNVTKFTLIVTKFTLIGRGLARGLLAAYWGRRGYDVDLYERRADSRAGNFVGGASINLSLSLFRNKQGHED